jgi:hypothetical protein
MNSHIENLRLCHFNHHPMFHINNIGLKVAYGKGVTCGTVNKLIRVFKDIKKW